MSKPSGALCNIKCHYCFYLEKENLYPERKTNWRMDDVTLENYIRKYIQSQEGQCIEFVWQGGEPTLMGRAFYQKAIELQNKYKGNKTILNALQTNGINIDDEWSIFLKKNNFLVGISIDGDRLHHDKYRLSQSGKSVFDQVMAGINCLKKYKVEFNTLTVVNEYNSQYPLEVYKFLKRIGSQYMQFIPLIERIANEADENGLLLIQPNFEGQCRVEESSVKPNQWATFMNTIFDYWANNDIGRIFVMNFEQTLSKIAGNVSACVINETCGGNLIVEANGDIYSCDHFVYPEYKLGNINHDQLISLVNSKENIKFGLSKRDNISQDCLKCPVKPICNGGCPKHRFLLSSNGIPNKNYLCHGFYKHYTYVLPRMQIILKGLNAGTSFKAIRLEMKKFSFS